VYQKGLFNIEYQSLKILSFRMENIDGVIGRLVEAVEDLDIPSLLPPQRKIW
jgi:hypothetical protein